MPLYKLSSRLRDYNGGGETRGVGGGVTNSNLQKYYPILKSHKVDLVIKGVPVRLSI